MSLPTNPVISPSSTPSELPEGTQSRRKHPCVLCQQRKVKCDRNDPCANCVRARSECISPTALPPRRRKKRFPEAELLARLRKYEEHLRRYGADIEAINNEGPASSDPSVKASPVESNSSVPGGAVLSIRRSLKHIDSNLSTTPALVNQEFQDAEELLQGSSDDEMYVLYRSPITKTYDLIQNDGSDLVFPSPGADNLRDLHPSTVDIFRLWQKFLDSINPIIKIFHAPTVQQQVLDASGDLDNIPKPVEALMFAIYSIAITSFSEPECLSVFGEEKPKMLTRFHAGARLALQRAGLLRSSDMTVLQAFMLYLMSCLNFTVDPRSVFCLIGIAVRIAQRMGLNIDGTTYGLQPFQVEMRRRLWWQIMLLDIRVSELSGAGHSVLNHVWETKLPLNVNDSDLFPDMRDAPVEHPGATEMVFVLQRCETAALLQKFQNNPTPLSAKDEATEELEKRLQARYIKYCDPSIPLHQLTILMTKLNIAKLHMGPRHPHLFSSAKNFSSEEKDYLFRLCLSSLENHNKMMMEDNLARFLWFILTNFPFPAHVYLLCTLRHRTNDELSDRAWHQFQLRFDRQQKWFKESQFWRQHKDSPLHLSFANLTIKAWEAREKELALPATEAPYFIAQLREQLDANRPPKTTPSSAETDTTPPVVPDMGMPAAHQFASSYQWFTADDPNQGFDLMPGLMGNENQSMGGWDLWNDLMQPTIPGYPYQGSGLPLPGPYPN